MLWSTLKCLIVPEWLCSPNETVFLVISASLSSSESTKEAVNQCTLPGAFLHLHQETCLLCSIVGFGWVLLVYFLLRSWTQIVGFGCCRKQAAVQDTEIKYGI